MPQSKRFFTPARALNCCLVLALACPAPALADTARFEIRAEPLSDALKAFAQQAHMQLLYEYALVRNVRGNPVMGVIEKHRALKDLLRNTGLEAVFSSDDAATIRPIPASSSAPERSATDGDGKPAKGQADSPGVLHSTELSPTGAADPKTVRTKTSRPKAATLQQVVVTGTLIPGVRNLASPLTVLTRADIADSGAPTLQDFMQTQSFDFGGGASVNTIGSINGGASANDVAEGTGFNLRGLGNDATLVLFDGHRIAPGNVDANFVDTSLIPLIAMERVEVEPAGASATYGADAVGGVVNIIPIHHFSGLETQVQYGSVAQSGSRELQIGQIAGESWNSGNAVLAYELYDSTPLNARDRSYLYPVGAEPTQFTLMNEQVRQSAFLSVDQSVSNAINIYATGLFSHRGTDLFDIFGTAEAPQFANIYGPDRTSVGEAILGTDITITPKEAANFSVAYSGSQTQYDAWFNPSPTFLNIQPNQAANASYSILTFNGTLTGSLFELPSGPLQFAIGGEGRREAYDLTQRATPEFQPSRTIQSAFLELNVPLLEGQSASSAPILSADLAGRIDHYSDFGTSTNPNVGIAWHPISPLKLRATFGTSYVAPDLAELNGVPTVTWTQQASNPSTGGLSNVLITEGGNPDLKPETADVFTLGADFGGDSSGGFHGGVTYYHIDFQNVITSIDEAGIDLGNALDLEGQLGPSVVQRNPPLSEETYLINQPTYLDLVPGGTTLSSIVAVVNDDDLNLSRIETNGVDLRATYTRGLSYGTLAAGFDGTYILKFQRQITSESPILSLLNTPYNPVNFKARAKIAFTNETWRFSAFVNYINSYQDNRVPPTVAVASWTTLDCNIRYNIHDTWGPLKRTSLSLSALNATNRHPPFVAAPPGDGVPEADFDGANANVMGRVLSFEITLRY